MVAERGVPSTDTMDTSSALQSRPAASPSLKAVVNESALAWVYVTP